MDGSLLSQISCLKEVIAVNSRSPWCESRDASWHISSSLQILGESGEAHISGEFSDSNNISKSNFALEMPTDVASVAPSTGSTPLAEANVGFQAPLG
ncbi:hypothetical protein Sjap_019848 [Stephania japonica]|uniref:Uncharacterized protein n=1 Tax=Stephania japonica TaxID=461633 RepID=A0AAP0F8H2_9MAGN